jgi:hypothetical protein
MFSNSERNRQLSNVTDGQVRSSWQQHVCGSSVVGSRKRRGCFVQYRVVFADKLSCVIHHFVFVRVQISSVSLLIGKE